MSSLHQVAQHVEDLDRAVSFYRDVIGLDLIARFDPPGLAFFDLDGTRLLLEEPAPPALLYIGVEDIETRSAEIVASGVEVVAGPELVHRDDDGTFGPVGTEEWMTFFKDSEANLIAFVERKPV